jgi:hypothetical protein
VKSSKVSNLSKILRAAGAPLICLAYTLSAHAEPPPSPVNIELKTDFQYQSDKKAFQTKTTTFIPANSHHWIALTKSINGVVVLGRVSNNENKAVKIEYILVNTEKDNAVISAPVIIANLEQRADLKVDGKSEIIQISALAHETTRTK